MSFKFFFIFIIINILYFINSSQVIILPFDSFFYKGSKENISSIDDLAHMNLYSRINIGEPSYEIKTFLSIHHSFFSMTQNNYNNNENIIQSYYNISKSNSFQNITSENNLIEVNYNSLGKEKIELKIFNYEKNIRYNSTIDDMIFIYNNNKKDINRENKYYLNIGFQIINKKNNKEREKYNFINQLKKRNIINNYDWCIFYEKGINNNGSFLYNPNELINAKGQIIIGDLPNNYNKNFHISQLLTTYSFYSESFFKWALEFSNIYYNNSLNETIKSNINEVQININNYIILAPIIYFYKIKRDFFDYYISKNQCKIYNGREYITFYCQKSNYFNEKNLASFPSLYMEHKEFQYVFEFTYEDLFVLKDNKYWFLIGLSAFNKDLEDWNFGIIFLRKYNLVFNQDSKTIGFYNPNLPILEVKNENEKYIYNILILIIIFFAIFICSILLISIRFYFLKKFVKYIKDKKKSKHIYRNSKCKENKNSDINNEIDIKKENLLIEMKGLI